MTLYESWKAMAEAATTKEMYDAYWNAYFTEETENYKKILSDHEKVYEGALADVAKEFNMTPEVFTGFIDGANTSLIESYDVATLAEDTPIKLAFDWEKLFYNMLEAKAKWLSSLSEWDGVLSEERRHDITKEWRLAHQAVSEKTVGRNDPCPCGSGKKYKKCCGANL